jgi:ABC-2 type transport system permease protein
MTTGLKQLTVMEFKLAARDFITIPLALVLPTALVLAFGLPASSRVPDPAFGGARAVDSALPALAATLAAAALALTVLPAYFATYRERGILKRLSTTPAKPSALLFAYLTVHLVLALAALVLTLVVGMLAVDMRPPQHVGGFVLSYVFGLAAMFGISVLVAAVVRTARGGSGYGFLLFFPSLFFAGAYLPKEQMPGWLSRVGDFTPLGAFRITVQDSWSGHSPEWALVVFLAAFAGIAFLAASKVFRWE